MSQEEQPEEILSERLSQLSTKSEDEQKSTVVKKRRRSSTSSSSDVASKKMKISDNNDLGDNDEEQNQIPFQPR